MTPEQACLALARESGWKLNTAFVKAFVSAVTLFPVGSLVRTNRDEVGMVMRRTAGTRCTRSSRSPTTLSRKYDSTLILRSAMVMAGISDRSFSPSPARRVRPS